MAADLPLLCFGSAAVLGAYLVRGIVGFGSALIAVPLLALALPLAAVVPVISLLDYVASLTHGLHGRRLIRWRDLLPLVPFTAIGVLAGSHFLATLASSRLALGLGLFVVSYAGYTLLPLPWLRGSRRWAAPAGFLGGLVGALFGTGGPFYVIYLGLRGCDKGEFRATVATIFVIDGALRLASYLARGLYDRQALIAVAVGLPLVAVGLAIGGRIHTGIAQRHFVRLVSGILLLSGMTLIIRFAP